MNYVDLITERFGGVRALARALSKPTSTVGSWQDRGSIPDVHKAAVLEAARARGLGLTEADFFPHPAPVLAARRAQDACVERGAA